MEQSLDRAKEERKGPALSFETRLKLGVVGIALALTLVLIIAGRNSIQYRSAMEEIAQTQETLADVQMLNQLMTDAETAMRGFAITGGEPYLDPYRQATREVPEVIARLKGSLGWSRSQMQRLSEAEEMTKAQFNYRGRVIIIGRSQGLEAARERVLQGEGKKGMDELRRILGEIQREEQNRLSERRNVARERDRRAIAGLVALAGVMLLLLFAGGALSLRHLAARAKLMGVFDDARRYAENVIDSIRDPLVVLDSQMVVRSANRAFYQTFKTAAEQTEGRRFVEAQDGIWKIPPLIERLEKSVERHSAFEDFELRHDFGAMGRKTLCVSARPLYRPGNNTDLLLVVMQDITERVRLEVERERFFTLSHDLYCIAGMDGYFKTVNSAWERTLGYTEGELLGRPFLDLVHRDDRNATAEESKRLASGQSTIYFENRYLCKNGSYKWLLWSATPAVGEGVIYAVARDISEHKRTEEALAKLSEEARRRSAELEAVNQELEAFSYSVSHDLRAPLRHIAGFSDMLQRHAREQLDAKGQRFVGTIVDSARRMGMLIDDLLVFSRMGRAEMRSERVDLNEMVEAVIADLKPEIGERRIIWKKESLPEIAGDKAMLRQVFVNLLSNAVKYTGPRDPAEIEISAREEGREAVVWVKDNGVGFDPAYAGKLFGVFQRLHEASEFEGTGIGLANVRRIVTRHGGRVWAEGALDKGAVFHFSLPKTKDT